MHTYFRVSVRNLIWLVKILYERWYILCVELVFMYKPMSVKY